ncbi:hypothetical protein [Planktothrix agardhii]|uniref:hypothetical protein n=1 Tax=Planktothrix agardhii TaxID=1160 RepID=UPI001D0BBCD3|nr:hypothetical protein [Planktothrix agardhii]MCB8750711.1 hypothetical protein [Planktothrix agardhii 1810]
MLTDRQTVVLNLLTASIIAKQFNPAEGFEIPELTKEVIKMLGTVGVANCKHKRFKLQTRQF